MDALHPGIVPLGKVNFNAKHDYEYIKNYKILQNVFTKLGITKAIEVNKLIKGKYQDNLEFLQWMKRYWDINWQGGDYDPIQRRNQSVKDYEPQKGGASSGISIINTPAGSTAPSVNNQVTTNVNTVTRTVFATKNGQALVTPNISKGNTSLELKVAALTNKVAELKLGKESLAKERDFYFDKLRQIEIKCEVLEKLERSNIDACVFAKEIQDILYATSDDFETDGNENNY